MGTLASMIRNCWQYLASNAPVRSVSPANILFRNDDVCWDTPLDEFTTFCETFTKYGFRQLHGVTLYGKTMIPHGNTGPYDGYPDLCDLDNDVIRDLSWRYPVAERKDLLDFLNRSGDDIALHGLYHTDYSQMSAEAQHAEIKEGLCLLRELFPGKECRHFIAPFNRTNAATSEVCTMLGLELLAASGVHLEAELSRLRLQEGVWYRYHHHRFYPGSSFNYYHLSIPLLDRALTREMFR